MKDTFWDDISKPSPVPVGSRIRLISMPDDPDPIEPGTIGTIRESSNGAQLSVDWDNGRSLSLIVGVDRFEVI